MICIPYPYRAFEQYPGYFWNVDDDCLYSIKISGVLTKLKCHKANHFSKLPSGTYYYSLSIHGKRQNVPVVKLKELMVKNHIIPESRK